MKCNYFGICGSCKIYPDYEEQLQRKKEQFIELFGKEPRVFASPSEHFRARAEFRIVDGSYAMHKIDGNGLVKIDSCPIVLEPIYTLMPKIVEFIKQSPLLIQRLYRIDFLSGLSGEMLITLVYHKKIDEEWEEEARKIAQVFGINIVGRSRGIKSVIGNEFITEELEIEGKKYLYHHYEGSFTQPNPYVNQKMIAWVMQMAGENRRDLLELYCGAGNFTIPLSYCFRKVLATEVSKTSIKAAKENCILNSVENIEFVRLSSEEVAQAVKGVREFRRLAHLDLASYDFQTVFVDPPRCGLDSATRELVREFEQILYISCNPQTLHRDLQELQKSHEVEQIALFDQFPYTSHMECGVKLVKR
ncbi:tRNA (uridine(54)-C5)-methyltransferase TrmA [Nitratiruptor tergarcus]|uniref:tRNA (Uracil-5-)-methyltransferase n=1 Tax=Nitratiruptor tergarcus DSM 16512 TaxID=1069081 RepID=A0A1W1WUN2_9BACT|nr:tRNA (uridine(54)-C5)-methyltransferase TrmA [Nitratiruptor tergarcus]SMC09443.1 tRNA (uracil-5-)-methyltransferase [Nitratiruptor tergarcus DSM 16512]